MDAMTERRAPYATALGESGGNQMMSESVYTMLWLISMMWGIALASWNPAYYKYVIKHPEECGRF